MLQYPCPSPNCTFPRNIRKRNTKYPNAIKIPMHHHVKPTVKPCIPAALL
jgi:hypothetical protein